MTPTGSPIAAGVVSVLPFLRTLANPVLLGFAGVVALLGIALTVVLYRRTRVIRQLSFGVTSRPLARVDPTAASRVRLYYANQRITDASVVEITLDNTGSAAIQPSDLAGPVHITFAGTAYGLEDSVDIARAPVGLRPQLTLDRAELSIQPFLLNPGESLSVSLLVANYSEPPVLTARVTGIAELRDQATATHRRRQRTGRVAFASALAALVLGLVPVAVLFFGLGSRTAVALNRQYDMTTPGDCARGSTKVAAGSIRVLRYAGRRLGTVELRNSSSCPTAWPEVRLTRQLPRSLIGYKLRIGLGRTEAGSTSFGLLQFLTIEPNEHWTGMQPARTGCLYLRAYVILPNSQPPVTGLTGCVR
jgi:hypothetical protein